MPPIFRTLGPVAPPVNPEDIANKGYVDNISPEVLTYFRLSDVQTAVPGGASTYAAFADVGLGNVRTSSAAANSFSRIPFPIQIIRYGLTYQPNTITSYLSQFTQNYVMQLIRYNPPGTDPPFVVVSSATLPTNQKYLDFTPTTPVPLGISTNDVYQWTSATTGTSVDIGSINLSYWYEFKPVVPTEIDALIEKDQERITKLNEELLKQKWFKQQMKDFIKSQSITKDKV